MNRFKYSENEERGKLTFCGFCGKGECKEKHESRPVYDDMLRNSTGYIHATDINGVEIPSVPRSRVVISG